MTPEQFQEAFETGVRIAMEGLVSQNETKGAKEGGVHVIGLGELGIGNTAVSSCLLGAVSGESPAVVTGKGTGVENEKLEKKVEIVQGVLRRHEEVVKGGEWKEVVRCMGGVSYLSQSHS
jgi:nicotinate-nucleotide--dimethylbenzimidazole phosphoribosyltransferase